MPIGSTCRACGAALPPDLGWCARCFTPVTGFAARPPLHEPGSFVGTPTPTPRTSRWRAGPTSFGPVGKVLITIALLLFFPWSGFDGLSPISVLHLWFLIGWVMLATIVLRQVWRRERVPDAVPPSSIERFRERHPGLGRTIRLGTTGRVLVTLVAGALAYSAWTGLDDVDRYVWAALALVVGFGVFLATWNEL